MKNDEDAFVRKALASAEKAERWGRIKETVATFLALGVMFWLTERSAKLELRLEPLLIGAVTIAALCTAKIKLLINQNTKAVLQSIAELRRP